MHLSSPVHRPAPILSFQQIGTEIGRGAFAVVYQAFNVETGDFVAVKRFPLTAIDDESLGSIQVPFLFGDVKYANYKTYRMNNTKITFYNNQIM